MLIEQKPAGVSVSDCSGCSDDSLDDRPLMTISAHSIGGKRNHMEDFFDIAYQMKPCDQLKPNEWPYEYFYFGIFDGHGGDEAASYVKQHLLRFITRQKDFWSTNDEDVIRAIREGFAQTHEAMRKVMPTWRNSNRVLPSTAGTTASILFIKNGKFYSGHVGDSRIVISKENEETKQWMAQQVTEDHKPESEQETQRIQRAGGEVRNKIGVHRVVWKRPLLDSSAEYALIVPKHPDREKYLAKSSTYPVDESIVQYYQTIPFLAIARSLGDFWSLNPHTGQYIVSPEPDISCRPIEANDSCILLATDGLWNVMNSSYAIRILQELNTLKSREPRGETDKEDDTEYFAVDNFYDVAGQSDNHAESLVYIAYQIWERKRLRSDNITAVVAVLHDILGTFHRTNKPYATRASLNSSKVLARTNRIPTSDPIQIEQTSDYLEKIILSREPKFIVVPPETSLLRWNRLRNILMLPPDLAESHLYSTRSEFKHTQLGLPRNIARIEKAEVRTIMWKNDEKQYGTNNIQIYIKEVSDDPADKRALPTRKSKSGKEVRDASAQASQPMHDFGVSWAEIDIDQTLFADVDDDSESLEEYAQFRWPQRNDDFDEKVKRKENKSHGFESPDPVDDKNIHREADNDSVEPLQDTDGEKSAPKLRCLMNYSPPPRRTTRSSFQSMSENAKRKSQVDSSPPPKTKRRRSQPIQYAVK